MCACVCIYDWQAGIEGYDLVKYWQAGGKVLIPRERERERERIIRGKDGFVVEGIGG